MGWKTPNNDDQKKEFKALLEETSNTNAQYLAMLANKRQELAAVKDIVDKMCQTVESVPNDANLQSSIEQVKRLNAFFSAEMSAINEFMGTTQASGVTFQAAGTLTAYSNIFLVEPSRHDAVYYLTIYNGLLSFHNRPAAFDRVMDKFIILGFDKTTKGQQIIHQLEAAWTLYLERSPTTTASLITLREAIEMSLDELIARRPLQRPVPNHDKFVEIGVQLPASFTVPFDFENLRDEWRILSNELSGSKPGTYDRNNEHNLMARGINFLTRLLNAIDYSKLRK